METEPLVKYSGYAIGMHVWVTNPSNNNVVYGRIVSVKIKNCGYRNAEGDYTVNKAEYYDVAVDDTETGILHSVYPSEVWTLEAEALTRLLYSVNNDLRDQMGDLDELQQTKARINIRLETLKKEEEACQKQ